MATSLLAVDDNIDEFSEFESAQALGNLESQIFQDTDKIVCSDARIETSPCTGDKSSCNSIDPSKAAVTSDSSTFIRQDINQLFQDTFPYMGSDDDAQLEITDLDQNCSSHWLWSKLEDVDCIPQQQWEDSRAFQLMLHSLNIDSRNILQFCAAPIISHLEVKDWSSLQNFRLEQETLHETPDLEAPIPEVEFDWTSSEITNPLEDELCLVDTIDDSWNVSTEQSTINAIYSFKMSKHDCKLEFPDLSFMQSKILSIPLQSITSNQYRVV